MFESNINHYMKTKIGEMLIPFVTEKSLDEKLKNPTTLARWQNPDKISEDLGEAFDEVVSGDERITEFQQLGNTFRDSWISSVKKELFVDDEGYSEFISHVNKYQAQQEVLLEEQCTLMQYVINRIQERAHRQLRFSALDPTSPSLFKNPGDSGDNGESELLSGLIQQSWV
jgi:hypothetical protein